MPRVLDAHTLMEQAWPYFCDVEDDIQKALTNCDHRDLLPLWPLAPTQDKDGVLVTPLMQFHTREQIEQMLGDVPKTFLEQLKLLKPKAIGNLWVACSVNPSRMCYELTLAVPFSKE